METPIGAFFSADVSARPAEYFPSTLPRDLKFLVARNAPKTSPQNSKFVFLGEIDRSISWTQFASDVTQVLISPTVSWISPIRLESS